MDEKNSGIAVWGQSDGTEREEYKDKHLYLDIEYREQDNVDNRVCIEAVMNKVLIYDSFDEFIQTDPDMIDFGVIMDIEKNM